MQQSPHQKISSFDGDLNVCRSFVAFHALDFHSKSTHWCLSIFTASTHCLSDPPRIRTNSKHNYIRIYRCSTSEFKHRVNVCIEEHWKQNSQKHREMMRVGLSIIRLVQFWLRSIIRSEYFRLGCKSNRCRLHAVRNQQHQVFSIYGRIRTRGWVSHLWQFEKDWAQSNGAVEYVRY